MLQTDTSTERIQDQWKKITMEANRRFIEPTKNRSKTKKPRLSSVVPQERGRESRSETPTLSVVGTESRSFGKQQKDHPYTDTRLAPAASMSPAACLSPAKVELARKMALFKMKTTAGPPETPERRMRSRPTTPETEQGPTSERLGRRASVEFARTTREPDTEAPPSSSSSCATIPGNTYQRDGAFLAMRSNPNVQSNRGVGSAAARPNASSLFIDDDWGSTSSNDEDHLENQVGDQLENQLENQLEETALTRDREQGEIPRPDSEPSGENGWDVIGLPPFDNLTEEDEKKAAMDMETKINDAWKERAADVDLSEFTGSYKDHVIKLMARGTPPAFVTVPAARFLVRQLGAGSFKRSFPCRHPAWEKAYSALNPRDRRGMCHWIQNAKQGESQLYDGAVKLNNDRHCPVPRFPRSAMTDRQTLWELSLLAILCRALKSAKPSGQKKPRANKQSLVKTPWLENDLINGLGRVRPGDRVYGVLQSSPEWVRFLNHIPEGKLGEPPRPPQGTATSSAPSPRIKSSPQPSVTSPRPRRAAPKSYALEGWHQSWGAEVIGEDDDEWSPESQGPRRSVEAERSSWTLTAGAGDAGPSSRDAPWPLPSAREPHGAGRSRAPGNSSPVVNDSASEGGGPSMGMTPQPSQPTPPATDSDSYCLAAEDSTPTSNTVEGREGSGVDTAPQPRVASTRPHSRENERRHDGGTRSPSTCDALGQVKRALEQAQKHSKEAMSGTGKMASAGAREDWAKLENAVGKLEEIMESTHAALEEAIGVANDAQQACGGDTDAVLTARKVSSRLAAARVLSEEARDAQSEAARVVWKRRPEATRPVTVRLVELVESVDDALREVVNVLAARPKRKAGDDGSAATKRNRQ